MRRLYALLILWREWRKFLTAILAVTFSSLLIAVQCGVVLGMIAISAIPIDRSAADIWITTQDGESLPLTHPIPEDWELALSAQPEISHTEIYLFGICPWHKPGTGQVEMCSIIGTRLHSNSAGMIADLPNELRLRLTEPGTVVVDESDLNGLGLTQGVGEIVEISKKRVRVVGIVQGVRSITTPYVYCSLRTARGLVPVFQQRPDLTAYVVAKCHDPAMAPVVAKRMRREHPEMGTYTTNEFSYMTQVYWLFRTKAGVSMICMGILALLVGLVVTSQTLFASVASSLREYAVLDSLGIPSWRMVALVLSQAFWIGIIGVALSLPVILGLARIAPLFRLEILTPLWLLVTVSVLTLLMACLSGLLALRSLKLVEPVSLLR